MANLKNTTIDDTGFLQLPAGTAAQRPGTSLQGSVRFNTTVNTLEVYDSEYDFWRLSGSVFPPIASGGITSTVTINNITYRIHAFTSVGSSSFSVTRTGEVDYLIVAGGGGGGSGQVPLANTSGPRMGAGGGAGGFLFGKKYLSAQNYNVVVGAGGAGGDFNGSTDLDRAGGKGGNSSAFNIVAEGGGRGGMARTISVLQNIEQFCAGGSGGASSHTRPGTGLGIPGQGHNGGHHGGGGFVDPSQTASYGGGGGGGAGGPGKNSDNSQRGGDGGEGQYFGHIFGESFGENGWFAGGGGGGRRSSGAQGIGGLGGGGNGGPGSTSDGLPAMANTGGGGGGGSGNGSANNGGAGGSGIVIIRYRIS